jgi:deoxyguanosine kinase
MDKGLDIPHQFITIEGNIGAGKTTLCRKLADDRGYQLILEQFTDNPFLPAFYQDPERYAFSVELFFMTERHKQLQQELSHRNLFQQTLLSDYIFFKTLLFAQNNLNTEEYRLFQRLFNILNNNFPKPDILLYIHRSVEHLLDNIKQRGRSYEEEISPAYLEQIQHAYFDFFKAGHQFPIVILDAEQADFVNNAAHYEQIIHLLSKEYKPGIHRFSI